MNLFDQKFGAHQIELLPQSPGVYFFLNKRRTPIYIGQSGNLRKRLRQYRLAKRDRAQRKMRRITKQGFSLDWILCDTKKEAACLEIELIQKWKPKLNEQFKYFETYPYVGIRFQDRKLALCLTTNPKPVWNQFQWHGVYRSYSQTKEAFQNLCLLLGILGFRESSKKLELDFRGSLRVYRNLDSSIFDFLTLFLNGQSSKFLGYLSESLLEKPQARLERSQIGGTLRSLLAFYESECRKISNARGIISQNERDFLFHT